MLKTYESMALKKNEQGYFLAFSGGKDSQVIYHLAEMAGVKFRAVYNVTTIDPPAVVQFIREHYPEVRFERRSKEGFFVLVRKKGLPFRRSRWCCEMLKETGGDGMVKVVGVRCEESSRRAKLWKEFSVRTGGQAFLAPIAYWTTRNVWDFLNNFAKVPHCRLYDEGWTRIGCIGCCMASKGVKRFEFERYPRFERAYKLAAQHYLERRDKQGKQTTGLDQYWRTYMEDDTPQEQCTFSLNFDQS